MMPHEYEREIWVLKDRIRSIEKHLAGLMKDKQEQELANFNERARQHGLIHNTIYTKETDGQTDTQDTKRPEKEHKRYKKARKDGQETGC